MKETKGAVTCCDIRKLYQALKIIRDRPAEVGKVLLEQGGTIIPDQARKICRWKGHFKRLLNHVRPFHQRAPPSQNNINVKLCSLSLDELYTTIRQVRDHRAPRRGWHPNGDIEDVC